MTGGRALTLSEARPRRPFHLADVPYTKACEGLKVSEILHDLDVHSGAIVLVVNKPSTNGQYRREGNRLCAASELRTYDLHALPNAFDPNAQVRPSSYLPCAFSAL